MLQISGVLELRSHQLCRDALKFINSTICGMATTDFWRLMESYFGVDKDIDEAALDEAQSLTEVLQLKAQSESENVPSISKKSAETSAKEVDDDIMVINEEEDDNASAASSQTTKSTSSTTSLKTLSQKKRSTEEKYPNYCSLKEATLFYPTSLSSMHATGVNPDHITERRKMGGYKGYYCCTFGSCSYAAQTHGLVATHVRQVHLGHALGCHFCPTLAWWQARYWSEHMDKFHGDQMKFEPLVMPQGDLKAEEVDPDHFVMEEHFALPSSRPAVPIHRTEPKAEPGVHSSSRKRSAEREPSSHKSTKFASSDLEELFENN